MSCQSCTKVRSCHVYNMCYCKYCKAETESECVEIIKSGKCKNKQLLKGV
jgi:hypothetical protein